MAITDAQRAAAEAYVAEWLAAEPDLTDDELADLRAIIRPRLSPRATASGASEGPGATAPPSRTGRRPSSPP
jgi:hypothetical protein